MGVFGMRYPLVIIAVVVLALGSFADEAMLVSFALTLASGDSKNLTLLYALSMIGGVIASRSGAFILPKISEKIIMMAKVYGNIMPSSGNKELL